MHNVNAKLLKSSLSAVALTMLLAGCATVNSSKTVYISRCPPLPKYSKETQRKAADELKQLPPGSVLDDLVTDYGTVRDACRSLK